MYSSQLKSMQKVDLENQEHEFSLSVYLYTF